MKLKRLFHKYKELISYIFFGVLTTGVGIGSYNLLLTLFNVSKTETSKILIINAVSWILAVLFAYITNKLYVFEKKTKGFKNTLIEFLNFSLYRGVTLGIETVGLYLLITIGTNERIAKLITSIIVIILNYVFGKLIVFKKSKEITNDGTDVIPEDNVVESNEDEDSLNNQENIDEVDR